MEQIRIEGDSRQAKSWPTVLAGNIVYLLVLVSMIAIPLLLGAQDPKNLGSAQYYLRVFLLEVVLIGVPPFLYMKLFGMDTREVARFNRIKLVEVFFVVGMAIFGYGVIVVINLLWYWVVSHWGPPIGQQLPPVTTPVQYLLAILTIGMVPAIVEEFLFRGLILRAYERMGWVVGVVMTGILFGMLHLQLMTIPSIILLGIVITYVVYRTNSIFAGMIYHFIHNTLTVSLLFVQGIIQDYAGNMESLPRDITQLPERTMLAVFIVWGIIGSFALVLFAVLAVFFHKYTEGKGKTRVPVEKELRRPFILEMLPGLVAMAIVVFLIIKEVNYIAGLK